MHHTRSTPSRQGLLDWMRYYTDCGWQVFPAHSIQDGHCTCRKKDACGDPGKHPRTRHGFKEATKDPATIRKWAETWPDANVAVATGRQSGIIVIDIDGPEGIESIQATQKQLEKLPAGPTVKTGNGWHLYFRHPDFEVRSRTGILPGVDIRADGAYVIAPPSLHANGSSYQLKVAPDKTPPSELPDSWRNLLVTGNVTQNAQESAESQETAGIPRNSQEGAEPPETPRIPTNAQEISHPSNTRSRLSLHDAVREMIEKTLPTGPKQRHDKIFEFVRRLKALPELASEPVRGLQQLFRQWFERALPIIRTKDWDTSWHDFIFAWEECKTPWGTDSMTELHEQALSCEPPGKAVAKYGPASPRAELAALCRQLQRRAGDAPFFLSVRKAAGLLDVSPMHASRWLRQLVGDGFLKLVSKGARHTRRASEFRYIGGD